MKVTMNLCWFYSSIQGVLKDNLFNGAFGETSDFFANT